MTSHTSPQSDAATSNHAQEDARVTDADVEAESATSVLDLSRAFERASAPEAEHVITGRGLGLRQHGREVFTGIDVEARAGDLLVLQGAAGTGKTSLALALAGRLTLDAGQLEVCGHRLPRRAGAVRHQVALAEVRGVNDLDDALTVEQHVAERLAIHQPWWKPWVSRARVQEVLRRVEEIIKVTDGRAEHLLATARSAAALDPAGPAVAALLAPGPDIDGATRAGVIPPLRAREFISDLQPLERLVLGVVLALIGQPDVLVVDDVDALRDIRDRRRAWTALAALDGFHTSDGRWRRLTVVATCQHAGPLADIALGLRAEAWTRDLETAPDQGAEDHDAEDHDGGDPQVGRRDLRSVRVIEMGQRPHREPAIPAGLTAPAADTGEVPGASAAGTTP